MVNTYQMVLLYFLQLPNVWTSPVGLSFVLIRGKGVGNYSYRAQTSSYVECIRHCLQQPGCIAAEGNIICIPWFIGTLTSVYRVNTTGVDDIIAIRVDQETDTCPSQPVLNPPTFDNKTVGGMVVSNGVNNYYNITVGSKDGNVVWNFANWTA